MTRRRLSAPALAGPAGFIARAGRVAVAVVTVAALAVVLPAFAAAGFPDEHPADFRLLAPLKLAQPEGLQRVELPLTVLQASRTSALGDLRVFNAKGCTLRVRRASC